MTEFLKTESSLSIVCNEAVRLRNFVVSKMYDAALSVPIGDKKFPYNEFAPQDLLRSSCDLLVKYVSYGSMHHPEIEVAQIHSQDTICPDNLDHVMIAFKDKFTNQIIGYDPTSSQTFAFLGSPYDRVTILGPYNNEANLLREIGDVYIKENGQKSRWVFQQISTKDDTLEELEKRLVDWAQINVTRRPPIRGV